MKSYVFIFLLLLINCTTEEPTVNVETERNFKMGFTTWSFGPNLDDVNNTYSFIASNTDIYAEYIDNNIPWNAWINHLTLPSAFTNEIEGRSNRKIVGKQLLLSVSLLNTNRDEIAFDFDGSIPFYTKLDDSDIKDGYFKHVSYLVDEFEPDYLVIAIEGNELRLKSPEKWDAYKNLISDVKTRIKQLYPELKISESISLHNLYELEISNPQVFIEDIMTHVNQNDFLSISFYPFLKGLNSKNEFQETLDFLLDHTTSPIAFVETSHLAENLEIPNLNVSIDGNENEQNAYLETLIENADIQGYEFIIWWAHRDFDALWETFPEEVKDIGRIWRDTGLLDENGKERTAFSVWQTNFSR